MTGLREMFDEVAGSPGPPSRLSAEQVYAAGRRRRTRNGVLKGVAAVVAVLVAVGVGGAIAAYGGGERATPADTVPPAPIVSGPIQHVVAADADHFYVTHFACPAASTSCPKYRQRLFGSDDGGRTWQERGPVLDTVDLSVLGPATLVAIGPNFAVKVSTTGGRSWSDARRTDTPVESVPSGGGVFCRSDANTEPCTLYAIDPAARRIAPLAAQPAVEADTGFVGLVAGHLWIAGREGIAMSADAGRSWRTSVLPDPPACAPDPCPAPEIATSADGTTAYAVVRYDAKRERRVYRITAGGLPQRVVGADAVPYSDRGGDSSFVAADGTHVLEQNVSGEPVDQVRWWAATGSTYRRIDPDGLSSTVYPVERAADGSFYTRGYGSDLGIYRSTDGRHWSSVPTPGR